MYSENYLPNISYIERTKVLGKSREFANQQEDWGNIKKSMYIALMQSFAGMGYQSALALIPDGKYNIFINISTDIISTDSSDVLGGMNYWKAHTLITESEYFKTIDG
jgi:hypothetical protein